MCGAGKGMHSRLYRRVLNQYEWVHNCTAFSSLYNNSGLVGIFISTERSRSGQIFDIITKELQVRCHLTGDLLHQQTPSYWETLESQRVLIDTAQTPNVL